MQLSFPLTQSNGHVSVVDDDGHIAQMIEQVLFTNPGERVNRPDFGCGLAALLFEPANTELAAVTQALVRASLLRWLGDVIRIDEVAIESHENRLLITLAYAPLRGGPRRTAQFEG